MQPTLHLASAESLSGIWIALHRTSDFVISDDEIHYLRMLALTVGDDLVSSLLLKKLKAAAIVERCSLPPSTVTMNSFLEFTVDGGPRTFCQLVHPSPHRPSYGVRIDSLLGVGLLGLRAGQIILWPNERGAFCDLTVNRVENCPGLIDWLGNSAI